MFNNMSDDDANSTQLEGKKLKKRGVIIDGVYLEITEDSPSLMEDLELDEGQEYYVEREFVGRESADERDERLKQERLAAQKILQQQQRERQQQQQLKMNSTEQLNSKERGIMLSKNRGRPVDETEFRKEGAANVIEREDAVTNALVEKKNDMPAERFLLADNVDKLDFKNEAAAIKVDKNDLKNAIPAVKLPDVRDNKGQEREL